MQSGVQILGSEYSFAQGAGIYTIEPLSAPDGRFRETIDMGECDLTEREVVSAIDSLRPHFQGTSYSLILKNCNHFSDALCKQLLNKSIPSRINRVSWWGSLVSCLLPRHLLGEGPAPGYPSVEYSSTQTQMQTFAGEGTRLGGSEPLLERAPKNPTMEEVREQRARLLEAQSRPDTGPDTGKATAETESGSTTPKGR
eukprot:Platyproteum_vivax@DN5212_c0_g1_i2.p1